MKVGGSQIPPTFQFEVIKMIDENLTMAFFGYHSFDWVERSSKYVIAICDKCGMVRKTQKKSSELLCMNCAAKERQPLSKESIQKIVKSRSWYKHSDEIKQNLREINLGKNLTQECKDKISACRKITKASEETKLKMSKSTSGDKNPNWQGGISFGKYCPKFNKRKRKEIRDKYNDCDFFSGLHKDIINHGKNLSVHHIDYNKEQGCNGYDWELIPLSHPHHAMTNWNKWFWNKLFINALEIDKWYYK